MQPAYFPFAERTPDNQYRALMSRIYHNGRTVLPIQGEKSKMIVGAQWRFDIRNGFPLITERDVSGKNFESAIGEGCAFLNGARTQTQLKKFGCPWWVRWVTKEKCADFGLEEGDLGPASYGPAWTAFPGRDGKPFNQISAVLAQMKRAPQLRTHIISPWYPPEIIGPKGTRKVVVAPCHGYVHFFIFPETRELAVHHVQRSGDLPVGVAFNMIQYAALGLMVGHLLDYRFSELVYTFSDVHIYESQYPFVDQLLSEDRSPFPFPTVHIDESVKDIFDFRPEHFKLSEYQSHSAMKIPTPV